MLNHLMLLLAADPPPAGQPQDTGLFGNPLFILLPVGVILFYMLILRPNSKRQEQERNALLNNMKKNDKVITHAGIYGKIISVAEKEDEIVVEIDDKVRVKMVKNAILRNLTNEETLKEAEAAKTAAKEAARAAKKGDQADSTAVTTKDGGA